MHITIIEDEKVLSSNIAKRLIKNGYNVNILNSYTEYLESNFNNTDLYLIDISLKDGSGFNIIKDLRENKKIKSPIIITSGYTETEKKIYGLDLGADDYLAKPYSIEELIARIRANIRRNYNISQNSKIIYNNFVYDHSKRSITRDGENIDLKGKELILTQYMIFNIGEIVEKSEIINSVWGSFDELKVSDNTINVTVSNIRKKLGKDFKLKTLTNVGYILEE